MIEPYRGRSDEAFEKMFERDKDELRALGIPIEVGYVDAFFEDEPGYRIKRDAFELPEIDLEPDEAAVVGLAARVWQHAGLAAATSRRAGQAQGGRPQRRPRGARRRAATLVAEEPAFEPCGPRPVTARRCGSTTGAAGSASRPRRHLQPWGVVTARGRWYVVGHDTDRGEPRMFRLSRIVGDVATDGRPGTFVVPEGTDLRALTRSLAPEQPVGRATVLVRKGAAQGLRRRAGLDRRRGGRGGTCWSWSTPTSTPQPARCWPRRRGGGVEPPELRDLVVDRLVCRRGDAAGMSGAREQVARLLALVPYLQTHPEVALEQAAADFGVPARADRARTSRCSGSAGCPAWAPGDLIDVDMEARSRRARA